MNELLLLINMSRTFPLTEHKTLTSIAEKRAAYLCDNEFSHKGWHVYKSKFLYRGENLAKDFSDYKSMHEAFMSSGSHRANILNTNYYYIGLATKCNITVQEFGGN